MNAAYRSLPSSLPLQVLEETLFNREQSSLSLSRIITCHRTWPLLLTAWCRPQRANSSFRGSNGPYRVRL